VEVSPERSNQRAQEFYRRCGFDEEGVLFELHFPPDPAPTVEPRPGLPQFSPNHLSWISV
jgi:RimJ/RimL family protein N-acetyltransferase